MESLAKTLITLYRGTPFHDAWMVAFLGGAWSGLLGDKLAQVCRPVAMRHKELTIEVLDPGWLDTLRDMKPELLRRIRHNVGREVLSLSIEAKRTG